MSVRKRTGTSSATGSAEATLSGKASARPRAMSGLSQSMFNIGVANPFHAAIIHKLVFLERQLDIVTLRDIVRERFAVNWKFRATVTENDKGELEWLDNCDQEPDLEWHIKSVNIPTRSGSEFADQQDINNYVSSFYGRSMDISRPLWLIQVINNARNAGPDGESNGVILVRLHHVIGDGISLTAFIMTLYDDHTESAEKKKGTGIYAKSAKNKNGLNMWPRVPAYKKYLHNARVFIQGTFEGLFLPLMPGDTKTSLKTESSFKLRGKSAALCPTIPLQKIKDIKDATGCTVNDVLFACLAGVLRRYLLKVDGVVSSGTIVHSNCLINMRTGKETRELLATRGADVPLENKFNFLPIHMPVGLETPLQRLYSCKRDLDDQKKSPSPIIAFALNMFVLKWLPTWLVLEATYKVFNRITSMMSNVPGPQGQKYVRGIPVHGMIFFSPGLSATNFGIVSYNNKVIVSVLTDTYTVPNPQMLADMFPKEVEEMYEATQCKDFEKPRKQGYIIDLFVVALTLLGFTATLIYVAS